MTRNSKKIPIKADELYQQIVGSKIGKLTVLSVSKTRSLKNKLQISYSCKCDCGEITTCRRNELITKRTSSCGCNNRRINKSHPNWRGHEDISATFWRQVIRRSKKKSRQIEFSITIEDAWNKFVAQNKKCAYTGRELFFCTSQKTTESGNASLDRVDSRKGYTINNIQWVHKDVNMMKYDFSEDRFIEICNKITEINHLKSKQHNKSTNDNQQASNEIGDND